MCVKIWIYSNSHFPNIHYVPITVNSEDNKQAPFQKVLTPELGKYVLHALSRNQEK